METRDSERECRHNSVISDIWFYIRFFKEHEPFVLVFGMAEIIFGAIMPLFTIYLPKVAIDLVERRAASGRTLLVLGGFSLLTMLAAGMQKGGERERRRVCAVFRSHNGIFGFCQQYHEFPRYSARRGKRHGLHQGVSGFAGGKPQERRRAYRQYFSPAGNHISACGLFLSKYGGGGQNRIPRFKPDHPRRGEARACGGKRCGKDDVGQTFVRDV